MSNEIRARYPPAMYAPFFGLKHEPFSISPDPRYLYMSERHREALAHLLYGLGSGGGFVLLTGEIGAGKTTVCRCFLEQMPKRCNVAYIFNPKQTVEELLRSICDEFHIPSSSSVPGRAPTVKDYVDPLNEYLLRTHAVGQNNILIIDEAQNLSPDVLEQLRLLTNLETNERKLLQIVLIGQPELRDMLARPALEQLAQRVVARYHLGALSPHETSHYVRHRLGVAGLTTALPFDKAALERVHRLSRGVPRRINLLCDRAMLGAYAGGATHIDRAIVDKAAREVFGEPSPSGWSPGRRAAVALGTVAGVVLLGGAAYWGANGAAASRSLAGSSAAASVPAAASSSVARAASGTSAASAVAATTSAASGAALPASGTGGPATAALIPNEREAWRLLAPSWGLPASIEGDPCQLAQRQRVHCFKVNASLPLLRRLDRPGIVTLYDDTNRASYAVLTGLSDDAAILRSADGERRWPLEALARAWRGEFGTFWRAPPGYHGTTLADGSAGPAVDWVAARLAAAEGRRAPDTPQVLDAALKGQVTAFQVSRGLRPDGLVGPATFMQLNRASGVDEPRLANASRGS